MLSHILFILHFFIFITLILPSLSLPSQNVTLFGDASYTDTAISLTNQQLNCLSSSTSGIGRAFYLYPVHFLDPLTNSTASFSCRFSFSIHSSPSCLSSSDGIAFLISSTTDFSSLSNGYMGLPNSDKDSYFAVEFDTSYDPSLGDINGNHIGIDVNSVVSFASVDVLSRGVDLKSGKIITAWIEYRDDMKMVRVWVGYSSTRPLTPILASLIDLSERFKEFMHVGFSASNGKGSSFHLVHHWQFKTLSYSHSVSPMDDVEEGDCFLCYAGDSKASKKKGVMIYVILKRKKEGVIRKIKEGQSCRFQTNKVPMKLSLSEITSATMGFNRDRLVGEGASAKVYKGSLPFGGDVAVKRFEKVDDLDHLHNPFATEFATMFCCFI
ncbi:non-specific serine/threonine protein kinase [Trifolium repens]|nr:non-specific serine/threonine protein kinase [Trifolium repens]